MTASECLLMRGLPSAADLPFVAGLVVGIVGWWLFELIKRVSPVVRLGASDCWHPATSEAATISDRVRRRIEQNAPGARDPGSGGAH